MHLFYDPDFYIARTLVKLWFLAVKVAKAFFAGGGIGVLTASTGYIINADTSWTERPSVASIYFLDLARFCFFFLFLARKSLTSFSSNTADCIVIWHTFKTWFIAELNGLGGLLNCIRSSAFIKEAYFCNYI
jgi:hypothetical protein